MVLEDFGLLLEKSYIQNGSGWLLLERFCDKYMFAANSDKLVVKIQENCFKGTHIELFFIFFRSFFNGCSI